MRYKAEIEGLSESVYTKIKFKYMYTFTPCHNSLPPTLFLESQEPDLFSIKRKLEGKSYRCKISRLIPGTLTPNKAHLQLVHTRVSLEAFHEFIVELRSL